MKISTRKMSYEEWKEQRRKGIGGSDAGVVAGLNKWKSPIRLYLEKIGEFKDEEQNEAMYWGNKMEDLVAKEYSERTGNYVERRNFILIHPEHDWMIANLDRVIYPNDDSKGPGVLECKNVSEYRKDEWKDDEVPPEAYCQLMHYLAVTGYEWGVIAALVGGNKFVWKEFERDEDFINSLISIESEFWKRVEDRNPPPMDESEDSKDILKLLYPESVPDSSIQLPEDIHDTLLDWMRLKKEIKELDLQKDERENRIKALLGENEKGYLGNLCVTWPTYRSKRFDSTAVKKARPEIYQEFTKEVVSRRFDIKEVEASETI